jgi:predicted dinucleotide-binding enzyme
MRWRLIPESAVSEQLSASRTFACWFEPSSLADLVGELGPRAIAATIEEAATKGDIVVASVPLGALTSLPADHLKGKIVIDTMNYYPSRDEHIPVLDEAKLTSSELVQQHFKDSKVVKALFNLDFPHLYTNARPHGHPERTTLPIAGDDADAKRAVADFMDRFGYDALDTGSLADSWRIEPGTPIYVWPYVPRIPDHLSAEDRKKWYWEHSGQPVPREMAQALVDKAVRSSPVGGFSNVLSVAE